MIYRRVSALIVLVITCAACGNDGEGGAPTRAPVATATLAASATPANTPTRIPTTATHTLQPRTLTPSPPGTATATPTPTATAISVPEGTATLTQTPMPTGLCGDGAVDPGEECDDGNTVGGDGCAANCTTEEPLPAVCMFGGSSGAAILTPLFTIPLVFQGGQNLTCGKSRDDAVFTTDPELSFKPGEIPLVVKAHDFQIEPISVPGLVCVCLRCPGDAALGGNCATGLIGCGPQGLPGCSYRVTADSQDGFLTLSDDDGCPPGSSVLDLSLSLSLIQDGGACVPNCALPDAGPDCLPCTDDDPEQVPATILRLTTGTAEACTRNNGIFPLSGAATRPLRCAAPVTGAPFSCAEYEADRRASLTGVKWAGAFPTRDVPGIGDTVTTVALECVAP